MQLKIKIMKHLYGEPLTSNQLARRIRSVSVPSYLCQMRNDDLVTVIGACAESTNSKKSFVYKLTKKGKKTFLADLINNIKGV